MTKTTQTTSATDTNIINPYDGKSQEMSQLMLGRTTLDGRNLLEKAHLDEISDFLGFQINDNHTIRHKRTLRNHNYRADYRRMRHYTKSIKQYKRERERRRRVWQLSGEGKRYPEIAKELQVSERTVARDMKKTARYRMGKWHKIMRQMEQDRIDKFEQETALLTPVQRFRQVADMIIKSEATWRLPKYNRHLVKIIINMNDVKDGCPSIRFWPHPPLTVTHPMHFDFYVEKGGQMRLLGGLTQS